MQRFRGTLLAAPVVLLLAFGSWSSSQKASAPSAPDADQEGQSGARTVRAKVQARPGGPVEEVDMRIHEVPVDPPSVSVEEADLSDDELVLGLVIDGQPMAYPIRYLALYEVVNDRVGETSISPTW